MQNIQFLAPDGPGVYALFNQQGTLSYYGKSDNSIKSRLIAHHQGKESKCTQSSFYFSFEEDVNPSTREIQLLNEHRRVNGVLPSCNEKVG